MDLLLIFIVLAAVIATIGITYIIVIIKPRMNLEYDLKIKEKEIELKQHDESTYNTSKNKE